MRKRNISPERLIEAIKEYIDGKGSFDTIAEKYCITYETIRNAYEFTFHFQNPYHIGKGNRNGSSMARKTSISLASGKKSIMIPMNGSWNFCSAMDGLWPTRRSVHIVHGLSR